MKHLTELAPEPDLAPGAEPAEARARIRSRPSETPEAGPHAERLKQDGQGARALKKGYGRECGRGNGRKGGARAVQGTQTRCAKRGLCIR